MKLLNSNKKRQKYGILCCRKGIIVVDKLIVSMPDICDEKLTTKKIVGFEHFENLDKSS